MNRLDYLQALFKTEYRYMRLLKEAEEYIIECIGDVLKTLQYSDTKIGIISIICHTMFKGFEVEKESIFTTIISSFESEYLKSCDFQECRVAVLNSLIDIIVEGAAKRSVERLSFEVNLFDVVKYLDDTPELQSLFRNRIPPKIFLFRDSIFDRDDEHYTIYRLRGDSISIAKIHTYFAKFCEERSGIYNPSVGLIIQNVLRRWSWHHRVDKEYKSNIEIERDLFNQICSMLSSSINIGLKELFDIAKLNSQTFNLLTPSISIEQYFGDPTPPFSRSGSPIPPPLRLLATPPELSSDSVNDLQR